MKKIHKIFHHLHPFPSVRTNKQTETKATKQIRQKSNSNAMSIPASAKADDSGRLLRRLQERLGWPLAAAEPRLPRAARYGVLWGPCSVLLLLLRLLLSSFLVAVVVVVIFIVMVIIIVLLLILLLLLVVLLLLAL